MTIHTGDPFAAEEPDPQRRLRGRLGGAVTLWAAGEGRDRAGLTVGSVMLAQGEPGHLLALLDPDADLTERLRETGRGVVSLLGWRHRDLAEAFAGRAPAPGGAFGLDVFVQETAGPRLATALGWAEVELVEEREVGWSSLVTATVIGVDLPAGPAGEAPPLLHRRGRYLRPPATGPGRG